MLDFWMLTCQMECCASQRGASGQITEIRQNVKKADEYVSLYKALQPGIGADQFANGYDPKNFCDGDHARILPEINRLRTTTHTIMVKE